MPNHIQNKLQIVGDPARVKEIFSQICDSDGCIDFEKIIPSPQVIKDVGEIHHGIVTAVEAKYMANVDPNPLIAVLELNSRRKASVKKEDEPAFERSCKAYEETGFVYWYDWNVDNWGTKWNAYDQPDERNATDTMYFQTAWSAPRPIISKLAEMFPDVEINLWYADEDSGCNTGHIIHKGGLSRDERFANESAKAYDLYFELHPDRRDNYVFVDGKYKHKEDD